MHASTAAAIVVRHVLTTQLEKGDLFLEPIAVRLGVEPTENDWDTIRAALTVLAAEIQTPGTRELDEAAHTLSERGWQEIAGPEIDG
jgi:hypothetical protein